MGSSDYLSPSIFLSLFVLTLSQTPTLQGFPYLITLLFCVFARHNNKTQANTPLPDLLSVWSNCSYQYEYNNNNNHQIILNGYLSVLRSTIRHQHQRVSR